MLCTATAADGTHGTPGAPVELTGEKVWMFAFCPSARAVIPQSNPPINEGVRWGDHSRKLQNTYSVGYSERVTFETGGAANWVWRRIVFTTKQDLQFYAPNSATDAYLEDETPFKGQVRAVQDIAGGGGLFRQLLQQAMFQGTANTDYSDVYGAKLNRQRVRVLFDKTRHIKGDNDAAHWKMYRDYYKNGKTLYYNHLESGDTKTGGDSSKYSVLNGPGEGNMWVVDYISCANGAVGNQCRFLPTGTYYWHER